jgi:Leucine-rich repeat (LRR) protein
MLLGLLNLEELNLSCNRLKTVRIPSKPEVLASLRTLDLSMNELTSLPKELSRLTSLKVLDVQFNAIDEVPENVMSSMNSFLLQSVKGTKVDRTKQINLGTKFRRGIASLSSNSSCSLPQEYLHHKSSDRKVSVSRETHATFPVEEQSE